MKYFCLLLTSLTLTPLWTTAAEEATPPADSPEPLTIIVHKSNPLENVTMDELRNLCVANRRHWPNGRKVTVALLERGRAEREVVLRQVCRMTEQEFARHFLQGAFVGEIQSPPKELATAMGVRRFVFNVPGAIGFVRASDVDDSVKVLRLDERPPSDAAYALKVTAKPLAAPEKPTPAK